MPGLALNVKSEKNTVFVPCSFFNCSISSTTFEDCVNKGSKVDLVQANSDSMSKYGVQGTPTVFINGKKWERTQNAFVLEEFKAAVEAG